MTDTTIIPKKIFVTGTDTEVGKTVISAALCKGLGAGYWKPVQAGTEPYTDTERVRQWTGLSNDHFYTETHILKLPMSPHAAASREGIEILMDDFILPDYKQKNIVVEGAGGILVPLNGRHLIVDLIKKLKIPVLLVARSGLGTINHTLLSLQALRNLKIDIWGVVLNGPKHTSNEEAIRYYGNAERLYTFPQLKKITPDSLNRNFNTCF